MFRGRIGPRTDARDSGYGILVPERSNNQKTQGWIETWTQSSSREGEALGFILIAYLTKQNYIQSMYIPTLNRPNEGPPPTF